MTPVRGDMKVRSLGSVVALSLIVAAACGGGGSEEKATPAGLSPYESAIVQVQGLFHTKAQFTDEDQINEIWVDPSGSIACVEISVAGQLAATRIYANEQERLYSPEGVEWEARPSTSPTSLAFLGSLPYLELLAGYEHTPRDANGDEITLDGTVITREEALEFRFQSEVVLERGTLYPLRQRLARTTESGETVSYDVIYSDTAILDGRLDADSRQTCRVT
jgi:hypothetical protein